MKTRTSLRKPTKVGNSGVSNQSASRLHSFDCLGRHLERIAALRRLSLALLVAGFCVRVSGSDADPKPVDTEVSPQVRAGAPTNSTATKPKPAIGVAPQNRPFFPRPQFARAAQRGNTGVSPQVQSPSGLPAGQSVDDTFRRALVEEEAGQGLAAAIQGYQDVIVALDANRRLEATALFRLGECYRKEGKTDEALVQYRRVLTDFSDQPSLGNLCRANLRNLGCVEASPALAEANRAVQFAPGEPSPLAEWSFARKDGDLVADASGHGYDAHIHGNARLVPRWGDSQALEFDGSGDNAFWRGGPQDCGLSISKRLNRGFSELSVEAWLRKTPAWWMPIISRDLWDEPSGFGLYAEWSSGKVYFGHYDKVGHGSCVQSETTVQDGRWHHVVGTMQPAGGRGYLYRIYVDGQLDREQTGTWNVEEAPPEGGVLKIAYPNATGADKPYQGALASIAIFDVALTPAQVKARFEAARE